MEQDISKIEFDVCLLGCGAYGMPLAAYIKEKLQKTAIHIGGSLQLFLVLKEIDGKIRNMEYGQLMISGVIQNCLMNIGYVLMVAHKLKVQKSG